jgi:uncharacterized delta-60 repeat protein
MNRRARSALAALFASGLLVAMAAAAGGAEAAGAAAAGSPGSLDPSFANGGISVTPGAAFDVALQQSGDILVTGNAGVVRFLPDGAPDASFGTGGAASAASLGSFGGTALAVQPDQKIVLGGQASGASQASFSVVRFTTGGQLDTGFGAGGVATVTFPSPPGGLAATASTVLVQPDGKILVGGTAEEGPVKRGTGTFHAALARFNANGTPDTSFGTGGTVLAAASGSIDALGLDAAGDIFALPGHIEFSSAGQLDAAATPAAITASSHGGPDAFLPSGQYVIGQSVGVAKHDVDVQVQRFNADGSLASASPAFDFSGAPGLDEARDSLDAVAVQPNGQVVVAGSHFLGTAPGLGLARVNADGSLDAGFGAGGVLIQDVPGSFGYEAVLIQPDGKIVAAGTGQTSTGQVQLILARYFG